MSQDTTTIPYGNSEITVNLNTGAHQAHGSTIVSCGGTSVLVTAAFDAEPIEDDINFVPLRVDYIERFYAIHQILGPRYTRREGKPSDEAILTARMIDRSIRPHLPHNLKHPLHVVATVLSLGDTDPDTLSIIGASVAISRTGINWTGPIAASRVAIDKDDNLSVNTAIKNRVGGITVAGIKHLANMVEFDGSELSEDLTSSAFVRAIEANNQIIEVLGKITPDDQTTDVINEINAQITTESETSLSELGQKLSTGYRSDGRSSREIRDIDIDITPIDGTHGSARFSRGTTTSLGVVTLGTLRDNLINESIESVQTQSQDTGFIYHYNFPPYATGTAGRIGSPNRREVGHGYLARRALFPLLPSVAEYPYSIRVVSEILSSNGSSSMASVCAGSLALYTAGVPIDRMCAGVAIGLAGSIDDPIILVDITGEEDHHGLMDFKVAGTSEGITTMQLDTKNQGINLKIFNQAIQAAGEARAEIIDQMKASVAGQAFGHPENAPLVVEVPREHIGRIIGKGGSNIREIEQSSGARITIHDDRFAIIEGPKDAKDKVLEQIEAETREYHIGEDFEATVREFLPYGAIVELSAGREALLHVSELRDSFVEKTEDLLSAGDKVPVTIVETSSDGRIKVSIREKYPNFFADKDSDSQTK